MVYAGLQLINFNEKGQEVAERSDITKESDRQLLRRLAKNWRDKRIAEYISQLEAIAEAAEILANSEGFGQLDGAAELKERLQQLGGLSHDHRTNSTLVNRLYEPIEY